MWWRRSSQSSQKPVPTNDDVEKILGSLQDALGGDNPIYKILMQGVDIQASLEIQCAAIYEGISDLLSSSQLMTTVVSRSIQLLKMKLEGLNFSRTKNKNRENIFSGYLLRQQLDQFFNQSPDMQAFSKKTQILLTTLKNFLTQENDQLIKSMTALINSVGTKIDRKTLNSSKFPVYIPYQSKFPNAPNKSSSLDEVLTEIKMNMNDSDIEQLFDSVIKLQVDDNVKFHILKGIFNCLGNQCCGETYVEFIDLLLSSNNAGDAIGKVNEFKDALSKKVQELHQQFDTIVNVISDNLKNIRKNLGVVSGYDHKVKGLSDSFEELQCGKEVINRKVDNGNSIGSIKQLSEEQSKMKDIISRALELSSSVEEVLVEVVGKVTKRDEQLETIMQMNLARKVQQLKEFEKELESLSQQANIGELKKQIDELLGKDLYKKYLKSDEELRKMYCDDVKSDISSLQEFNTSFEEVEQNIIKIRGAIKHKQELEQIIQQAEDLCDQTKFLLEKLKKVQQELVAFIVNRLQQVKEKLIRYQTGPKLNNPEGAEETVYCFSNEICQIHEQKIEALNQLLEKVESLYETSGQLFVSIKNFDNVIEFLDSNASDSSIDKRFTKFWSIEIEKLIRIREYLQILNIDSKKLNNLISQLSVVENWLNDKKSFMDSKVDFNSNEIYINAIQTGKVAANQTEEHLNSMKEFLKEAVERIKQKIDDLQREYDERFDEINKVQLYQRGTHVRINDQSSRLKRLLCTEFQTLKKQTEEKDLSIKDSQFFNDIAELFTKESELLFDKWVRNINHKIKEDNRANAYNSEVADKVSNFVVSFVNDDTENVEEYRGLVRSYEEKEQQLRDLRTELYVIDAQKEQPKDILKILQMNLNDVIDFGDCERFLQDHVQAFITSPLRFRPNPPPEECDKKTTCSLM